ncbi:MAG: hypothetical protein HY979_03440 [Candidatus Magasanikbacteria bacterium]|nr:hypothetical protein [Candidatus Magasanikbacteria bacterium]
MSKNLSVLADAPLRFEVIDEDRWRGKPSVAYGSVRKLAYDQRKSKTEPYVRIFFGQGGRNGDPWGGLGIEVNGQIYHFCSNIENYPEFHDGRGGLTTQGRELLADGLPAKLHNHYDWRWVQNEVNITSLFTPDSIKQVAKQYEAWLANQSTLPKFQSQMWAKRFGNPQTGYNCTSSIVSVLNAAGFHQISGWYPLTVFAELKKLSNGRTPLDDQLNFLLWQDEASLMETLRHLQPNLDWNAYAKGNSPDLTPDIGLYDLVERF